MDATVTAVLRLFEQDASKSEISRRVGISLNKVTQILVTNGFIETDESKLFASGKTIDEIAELLGKSRKAVQTRIPYQRCMYNAEYPTINAIRVRQCKARKAGKP